MIFMRENREHVTATFKPKHSVEANSILGRMWKSMTSEQQHRCYLLAAKERRKHEERHPNWSSKDNYGRKVKRKRRKVKAG
ncbi:lymphoid enhancer-binding factor 1-like [Synchiropus picturatus]